jgi:hypothetical protein
MIRALVEVGKNIRSVVENKFGLGTVPRRFSAVGDCPQLFFQSCKTFLRDNRLNIKAL